MKTISTKMKLLSMALLGLGGVALASSAAAQCPTAPDAWTGTIVGGGTTLNIDTPGMDGTNCQLNITQGTSFLGTKGLVYDDSPQDETRYRARFYLDLANVASDLTGLGAQTFILNSLASTTPGVGVSSSEVKILLIATFGGPALRIQVGDTTEVSSYETITYTLPASATDQYRIEFDLQQGTGPNNFRYWITDHAASTSDTSPTGQATVDNAGWSGVTSTNMGIYNTNPSFRNGVSGAIGFDQFDSRRQTFIGK